MTLQLPEPVDAPEEGGDADAYYDFLERQREYFFITHWLPITLTPAELAGIKGAPSGYLKDLYPEIYEEGPLGYQWYAQLRRIKAILDGKTDASPSTFLSAFIEQYEHLADFPDRDGRIRQRMNTALAADDNVAARMPDVEGYEPGTLVESITYHPAVQNFLNTSTVCTREDFLQAMNEHARIVLSGYVIKQIRQLRRLWRDHERFLNLYNLG